jgi:hypothetical protein
MAERAELNVGSIVRRSYASVFKNFGAFAKQNGVTTALLFLLWMDKSRLPGIVVTKTVAEGILLVWLLLSAIILAAIAVRWHRRLSMNETVRGFRALHPHRRDAKYLAAAALLAVVIYLAFAFLVIFIPSVMGKVTPAVYNNAYLFAMTLGTVAVGNVAIRWSIAFPLIAVDHRDTGRTSWQAAYGYGWQLFAIVIAVTVPAALVILASNYFRDLGLDSLHLILTDLIKVSASVIGICLLAAALSFAKEALVPAETV